MSMKKDIYNELDDNPSLLLNNLLENFNKVDNLIDLAKFVIPTVDNKVLEIDIDLCLVSIKSDIFKLLENEFIAIAMGSYDDGKQVCTDALDSVYHEMQNRLFFIAHTPSLYIRKFFIYCLTLTELGNICRIHGKYSLGLNMYQRFMQMSALIYTYRPTPIEKSSDHKKNVASIVANYIWNYDVSKVLMPIHVAELVKRFTGIKQTPETIVKWLKEYDAIPKEITQKTESGNMPRNREELRQQRILYDTIYNERHSALINVLESKM